jgi:integrase
MPLTIYRRGAFWHYRGSIAGRRLRGSTRTADEDTALQIVADLEARAWKRHIYGPEAVLTFAQAAILYRQAGRSPRFLDAIEDYWKNTPVRKITPGAVRQSALQLYPNAGGATRNRQVIVPTQAIVNHAAEAELCRPLRVKRFPVEKREKTPATWAWVQAFMAHANPHLGALACFMFGTGARISEALAVTWNDVDLKSGRALIRQTKVGNERTAHLPAPLIAAIANIEGDRIGKVFKYSSRSTAKVQWNKAVRRAGLPHLSFHACRHGFATALLHAGVDPVTVARRGGWATPQHVLSTYGHASEDLTVVDRIFEPGAASGSTPAGLMQSK